MVRFLSVVSLGLALSAFSGCAASTARSSGLLTRLNGRGPVLLSPDNPFLVGNLVLAREMESSPVLRGFVKHRGAPPALEVTKSLLAPYRIVLYYPDKPEQFDFEQAGDEWIIDGPGQIDREKLKDLILLTRNADGGEPKLLSRAELEPSPESRPNAEQNPAEPSASESSHDDARVEESAHSDTRPVFTPFSSPPGDPAAGGSLSDREAVARAGDGEQHPAEITAKGDLVHYVTMSGESLSIIARWYTYDRSNAGRLARINGIKDQNSVGIGDTIIVPAYLVRNKNRLTKEGFERLKAAALQEKSSTPRR